ncbi:MAG: M6 family metalloprotease domain-containing protein [candidate division WOR-3 bacterium]|nr:MAG: M6 family metalloprotease domain-containing protein [candidate division WOR-3 bacterium]
MKKIVFISCVEFMTLLFAMPVSPVLEQRLKNEGRYNQIIEQLIDAKRKGVDAANLNPVRIQHGRSVTLNAIAILVDFSDNVATTDTLHYDSLLASLGTYPTGSFRDYFLETSYDSVDIIITVVGWLRMDSTYAFYVDGQYGMGNYPRNSQKLAEDAVWAADPLVDFSQFDNDNDGDIDALFIVHAGPGAESTGNPHHMWSHAWWTVNVPYVDGVYATTYSTEPENGNIGVFCHEAGHSLFGLPDLYDYGYDSYGVGMWSLMGYGGWGNGGRRPTHLDAWCKIQCGFLIPQVPTSNQTGVQFPSVEFSPVVYKLWTAGAPNNEFFLAENRQKVGFDNYLPAAGMLIYHVDENQSGNNNQWYPGHTTSGHYLVAVEQADGRWDLEQYYNVGDAGDPYPGSFVNRTFNDTTIPDSKDYLFNTTSVSVENISDSGDTMTADINVVLVGIEEITIHNLEMPKLEVYPSITNDAFTISFLVNSEHTSVSLRIYDAAGRLVKSFDNVSTNIDHIIWRAKNEYGNTLPSGIYFVQLTTDHAGAGGSFSTVKRVILVK